MMPHGIAVKGPLMPPPWAGRLTMPRMAKKSDEDREMEARLRGYVRQEMFQRRISLNEAGRRMGLGAGTLSKILSETRGFGSGFILRVRGRSPSRRSSSWARTPRRASCRPGCRRNVHPRRRSG
jgi:hypothetical protein